MSAVVTVRFRRRDHVLVPGDIVKLGPSRPGKRDGYVAKVMLVDEVDGAPKVEVWGAKPRRVPTQRWVDPARIVELVRPKDTAA